MEFEIALNVANEAVFTVAGRRLTPVEVVVLQGSWKRQSYEQIANTTHYSVNYLKLDVGPKLWKLLSQALGETVSKITVQAALERQWRRHRDGTASSQNQIEQETQAIAYPLLDWGEAMDVSIFYGRTSELERLTQWVMQERCRLVMLLGMGGMGKSALAAKLAHHLQHSFEFVIWRSLRNAPPVETLLSDLVPFLSQQQDLIAKPHRLLHWLRTRRCLVVLDNVETILQAGDRAGLYQLGYEDYGDLFNLIGESAHQSCVILTSREKPAQVSVMESTDAWVRSLHISGSQDAALALLDSKGLIGTEDQKYQLCEIYNHNPLALKIVASSIQNLFGGDIPAFFQTETIVFSGIRRLLDQQFERLSELEQTILYWLAINREWTSIPELLDDIVPNVSPSYLLDALESLRWRCLIETVARSPTDLYPGRYTQQSVVMEYVTGRLIEHITTELLTQQLDFFNRFALTKTTSQDYIRESQIRVIVMPIVTALQQIFKDADLELHLRQTLKQLTPQLPYLDYAAGNLLNLLCQIQTDLINYDFSHLTLRHAYLQRNQLHRVNFSHAHITQSTFVQAFATIFSVAFSPNNHFLATGEINGRICIWRVTDTQLLFSLEGHIGWLVCLQFSPDNIRLASACADHTVKLWNVQTGQLLITLQGHSGRVNSVSFNSLGTVIVSGGDDQTIRFWDVHTGHPLKILQGSIGTVHSVVVSPDDTLLVSGSDDGFIRLWDTHTGELLTTLQGHDSCVRAIAFSPNGLLLASGSADHTIKLWNPTAGKLLKTLAAHTDTVKSLAFSAENAILVSSSDDCTIKRWDVETGMLLQTLQGHLSPVSSIALSADQSLIASGSFDQTIKLWDAQTGQRLRTLQGYVLWMRSVSFSPDGAILASGSTDHRIRLWDVKTGTLLQTLHDHQGWVWTVSFSRDGTMLASASNDYTIKLWDVQTGTLLNTLEGHRDWVRGVSFSPDGMILASGSCDCTLRLWDTHTGKLLKTVEAHDNSVTSVGFSPTYNLVASCSRDQTLKLWDATTGELVQAFPKQTRSFESIAWSRDGLLIGSSSSDHTVQLWNAGTGELLQTLEGHQNWVRCVALHPHRPLLASGSFDCTIKLWDIAELYAAGPHESGKHSKTVCRTLEGHTGWVLSIAFSPDGEMLASCSTDGTIRFWDIETGDCLTILKVDRPYEGLNITGVTGITDASKENLCVLGAYRTENC
ncbi:MAG TPA: NB-ARC domain-containing protein [Crinalium sp.]|jgi:WD40 repeat protein